MPTPAGLRGLARARIEQGALTDRLRDAEVRLRAAQAESDRLIQAGSSAATIAKQAGRVDRLATTRDGLARQAADAVRRTRGARDAIVAETPETAIGSLDGQVPIALLPVRVETRFADGGATLHVRIFPDQIHVDAHEPALTADEVAAGQAYWERRWPAPADAEVARLAWTTLASGMRPTRARWVAEATRPAGPLGHGARPVHAQVPLRPSAWTRAARAGSMPSRWVAIGLRGGRELFRVWSGPVTEGLEVGPAPEDETAMSGTAVLGEGLRWLADPELARAAGVLLTVRDSDLGARGRLRDGLDQLVVLGVDWTGTPEAAADALAELLAAHARSDGLAFVAQGTPTNNTAEVESGQTSDRVAQLEALDPAREESADASWSAGPRLATALGLAAGGPLEQVPGMARADHRTASALVDAMWEATAGTYLGQVLRPMGSRPPLVSDDQIDRLRLWAASNVFAAGPLPVIRVGRQPYGLLPVVDPGRYQPTPGDEAARLVRATAALLRRWWERGAASLPRLGPGIDVDATLIALLQRSPVAAVTRFRRVFPECATANITGFDDLSAQQHFHGWLVGSMFGGGFVDDPPRIGRFTTDPRDHALRIPWARPAGLAPGAALPYIAELRAQLAASGARDRLAAAGDATSLAQALITLSAALELDAAHGRVVKGFAVREGILTSLAPSIRVLHPDSIGVGLERAADTGPLTFGSPKALADAVIPRLTGARTVAEHVRAELGAIVSGTGTRPGLDGLRLLVDALDRLRDVPGEEVEWALRGLLDLYAYRLDAWLTGLATARLKEQRGARPRGLHVGCFGWLEGVRPDPAGRDSLGYVHTPSIAHAVAAAILRSGHVAHRGESASTLAIDLSARRVRRAMAVLDGVETGQPLGALLGYRLERSLRDRDPILMRYVLPLRRLAPLRHTDADLAEPMESIAARDVVDAVALLDRWRAAGGRAAVLAAAGVITTHRSAVSAVIDDVDDVLDAVADVLLSESVYQTVLGNQERARAALAALDRQERPVSPTVVRTPRSGTTVTHRVLLHLREASAPGWAGLTDARSAGEPRLDAWIGRLLGRPARLVFGAQVVRGTRVRKTVSVTAADLGLSPLALVLASRRQVADQPSELESRLARILARRVTDATPADRLVLLADPPRRPAGAWGLAAVRAVAVWVDRVAGGRAASAGDLGPVLDDQLPGFDVGELSARADSAVATLGSVASRLKAAATGSATTAAAALASAADLGIVEALSDLPGMAGAAPDRAALRAQVAVVRARVDATRARLADAKAAFAGQANPTVEQVVDHQRGRLRMVFGEAYPVLPLCRLGKAGRVAASAADRRALLHGDDLAPLAWLHRVALVRPSLLPLSSLLTTAEANGRAFGLPRLDVVQLPHRPGQRWVALPAGAELVSGTVGIVVHAPGGFDPRQPAAGIVVDEWTETIPSAAETTALSFHYDAPAAQPPQAVILALTGAPGATRWSFDELLAIVRETMALARLRAVGPRDLPDLGGYLPGLYVPQDVTGDVPGFDLFGLADRARLPGLSTRVLGKD